MRKKFKETNKKEDKILEKMKGKFCNPNLFKSKHDDVIYIFVVNSRNNRFQSQEKN